MSKVAVRQLVMLIALAFCWGPSFFFIKLAVYEIPPTTLILLRVAIGAAILWTISFIRKANPLKYIHLWRHFLVIGIASSALPFTLISFGELYISSSLAAITNASVPIFTALITIFLRTETVNFRRGLGILIGFAGIVAIFFPSLMQKSPSHFREIGLIAVLIASISYAVGMVYSRIYLCQLPALIAPSWQTLTATLVLIPFSLWIDKPFSLPFPSPTAICGLLGLAILGTAMAFILYFQIVRTSGAVTLSFVTLLFPIVGLLLGVIFLKEKLAWNAYLGCGLILSGLLITNPQITPKGVKDFLLKGKKKKDSGQLF